MLLISPYMHSHWMPILRDYLFKYRFLSRVWLSCKEVSENPLWKNLYILLVSIPVSYLSTLTFPISFLYTKSSVSVLLIGYEQSLKVQLIPADSDLPLEPARLTVQLLFGLVWKSLWTLEGSNPRQDFFSTDGNLAFPLSFRFLYVNLDQNKFEF